VTSLDNEGKAVFRSKRDREGKLEIIGIGGQNIEIFIKNINFQDLTLLFSAAAGGRQKRFKWNMRVEKEPGRGGEGLVFHALSYKS